MYLNDFLDFLMREKRMTANSQEAYKRDLIVFEKFVKAKGSSSLDEATNTDIVSYLFSLKNESKSPSTINRKLASIRAYYNYLIDKGVTKENPTKGVKAPKVERKEIEYLSIDEVEALLALPEDNLKGARDKAILETLYATGIRVNEVVSANVEDVNLRIGFFTCHGDSGKARIIPMGRPAKAALEEYIHSQREALLKGNKKEKALFVNYSGKRMTRQGLWKILKEYGDRAELNFKLTPHILRNSFAVHMVQNGADLKSLQELLGHEDATATQIYLSVTKNRIKDVYDKTHPRA